MKPEDVCVGTGSRYSPSPRTLSEPCARYDVLSLYDALTTRWAEDQHFTCYQLVLHQDGQAVPYPYWPRLNNGLLSDIRLAKPPSDVQNTILALDYDLPAKREWAEGEPDQFFEYLATFRDQAWNVPATWTAAYSTQHGVRLIYVLTKPLKPEKVPGKVAGLIRDFVNVTGLVFDKACKDWTRLFRLPQVIRDGVPTWEQPYYRCYWQPLTLDPDTIAEAEPDRRFDPHAAGLVDLDVPTPEECRATLYEFSQANGREVMTPWYKVARARLRGRESLEMIEGRLIVPEGSRDNTLTRAIGQVCGLLVEVEDVSAVKIYALFDDLASQLAPDHGTPDWRFSIWSKVKRFFGKELADLNDRKALEADKEKKKENLTASLIDGVRQWCHDPAVQADDNYAWWWIRSHAIVASKKAFYVLRPNGHYDSMGVPAHLLTARIRELGMDQLIPLTEPTLNGGVKDVQLGSLVKSYVTVVSSIEGAIDIPETQLINPGTPSAKLVFRMFQRKTDLEPQYSAAVDEWLRSWCQTENDYHRLNAWIGHALNFEEGPICALSLFGPPGCGKKMLSVGLAECINTESFASGREFETQYGGALLRTPFVFLNEGLPANVRNFADMFRRMVGGDPIEVNAKFQDPITIRNPIRMVISANNMEALMGLVGHNDLTLEDQKALSQRILHLNIAPKAGLYLERRGGLKYTGSWPNRWIRGDAGAASDYVVARHFLWLYEKRPKIAAGSRMLVEGSMNGDLMRLMSLRSGSTSIIVEALVHMIERDRSMDGCIIFPDKKEVFVTASAVMNFVHQHLYSRMGKVIHIRNVSNALRGLCSYGGERSMVNNVRARWYSLDLYKLYEEAIDMGYKCSVLFKMLYLEKEHQSTIDWRADGAKN